MIFAHGNFSIFSDCIYCLAAKQGSNGNIFAEMTCSKFNILTYNSQHFTVIKKFSIRLPLL